MARYLTLVAIPLLLVSQPVHAQALTSTAAAYREAAIRWRYLAAERADDLEDCLASQQALLTIVETEPEPKKATPWWVWPLVGVATFAGGAALGVVLNR